MAKHYLPVIALLLAISGCGITPRWHGPVSDHFNGSTFYNRDPMPHGFLDLIDAVRKTDRPEWQFDASLQPGAAPAPRVLNDELILTWINHATVLIQAGGLNILTDPIWSERASPVSFAGPRRFHAPGIRFEDLPAIDVVIISHSHYDHMDKPTLQRLARQHDPLFVVPAGNKALLDDFAITRVSELDWQQSLLLKNGCRVVAQPVQHWSNRRVLPSDKNYSLWAGYVLETPGGPVYFGGDAGYAEHFADTGRRHGPIRAALLPIGAYLPRWFMQWQHMGPAEAVQAHRDLRSAFSVPIHWGTFQLAAEGQQQAADDLHMALLTADVEARAFPVARPGDALEVPALTTGACRTGALQITAGE